MSDLMRRISLPASLRDASQTNRASFVSESSESSGDERDYYDDNESMMHLGNDSQSSLDVSLEDMDLDSEDFEERCRMSPISRLPAELLIAIFSKLSSSHNLMACMLVSKGWARCSVDLLWHRPATGNWPNLLNVIQTVRKPNGFFAYHDLIRRLNLAQLKTQISDGTILPLSNCKRVERLTLTDCSKLTDLSVAPLIEGNRNLLAIDLSGLEAITDKTMSTIAANCYKLQGLNMTKCMRITDDSLAAVAQNCRRVKRLKLNECPQLTDHSVLAFADNCHDLLEIDLHGCVNLTDISVTALLTEGRQLRELRLAQCSLLTDESFLSLPMEHSYENLRVLDLTDCNSLTDAGISKIVNSAPRLRNLVLAKCREVTDRGVVAVTRLGKNLHYIHLGHCSRITDYGVSNLVKFCSRIRYIDLACCTNLTDDSIALLAALPKLKRIGLVKCAAITDRSLRALARSKTGSGSGGPWTNMLERLHLSYCSQLTIAGIRTMLINCPKLTHLSLTGVPDVLREDLVGFCRQPPEEFNPHQRDVFCVFSGDGVERLRRHLHMHYPGTATPDDSDDEGMLDFDATSAALFQPDPNHQPHWPAAAAITGAPRVQAPHQTVHALAQHLQAAFHGLQAQNATLGVGAHAEALANYQQQLSMLQQMQQAQHHAQQRQQHVLTAQQHAFQNTHAAQQMQHQQLLQQQQFTLQQQQQPQMQPIRPQTPLAGAHPLHLFQAHANTPHMTPDDFTAAHLHAHPFTPAMGTPLPQQGGEAGQLGDLPGQGPVQGLGLLGQGVVLFPNGGPGVGEVPNVGEGAGVDNDEDDEGDADEMLDDAPGRGVGAD